MADKTRYTGKVKTWAPSTGYGFVTCPKVSAQYDNQDVYLHQHSLMKCDIDPASIAPGMMVSFEVFTSPKGLPQASAIKVISGGDAGGGAAKAQSAKGPGKAAAAGKTASVGKAAAAGKADSWGKGDSKGAAKGKGTAYSQAPVKRAAAGGVDQAKLIEAVVAAAGEGATASVLPECAKDGSPQIKISLTTLNTLLKNGGHAVVEGCQEIPDEAEALVGFDGKKVDGPWFVGTLKEYFPDQAYGFVESAGFKEQFGDKECFIHGDHLDPEGTGNLLVKEGEEIIFPLVEDEEGNAWAWAPVIPKNRNFLGTIETWQGGYGSVGVNSRGTIHCETLWPVFEQDVYCNGKAAEYGGIDTTPGKPVVFNLHVNKEGKPQASSPRPPGSDPNALPGFQRSATYEQAPSFEAPPAKRQRVEEKGGKGAYAAGGKAAAGKGAYAAGGEDPTWYQGIVKSFNDLKGFGFIDCAGTFATYGRDVFLHHAILAESGGDVGSHVQFQVMMNAQGHPQAQTMYVSA